MPEVSPGTLSLFAAAAADRIGDPFVSRQRTGVRKHATTATIARARSRLHRRRRSRRVINADRRRYRYDDVEKPADDGRPTVFLQTLRGGTHGARLSVHILLHALPEFADRQV